MATGAAAIERLLRSAELNNWLTGLTPQGHAAMVSPLEPPHEVAYPIYRDLASKHVLVTGGAQGIGLAVNAAPPARVHRVAIHACTWTWTWTWVCCTCMYNNMHMYMCM